jgi:hypothetical protein
VNTEQTVAKPAYNESPKGAGEVALGQPVVLTSCRWEHVHIRCRVTQITASGRVVLARDDNDIDKRTFVCKNGRWHEWGGKDCYDSLYLRWDVTAVAEERARFRRQQLAADALNHVMRSDRLARPTWTKESMLEEVTRLEAVLAAARTAVEAI